MPNVAEQLQLTDPSNTAASVSRLIADALSSYSSEQLAEYPKLRRMSTMPGAVTRQAPMPGGIGPVSGKLVSGPYLSDVVTEAANRAPALFAKVERLLGPRRDLPIRVSDAPPRAWYTAIKSAKELPDIEFNPNVMRELRQEQLRAVSTGKPEEVARSTPVRTLLHEVSHGRHNLEAVIEPQRWAGRIFTDAQGVPWHVSPQVAQRGQNTLPGYMLRHANIVEQNIGKGSGSTELAAEVIARKALGISSPTKRLFIRKELEDDKPIFVLRYAANTPGLLTNSTTTLGVSSSWDTIIELKRRWLNMLQERTR